ncbi:MAG: HAD family hydrolase [Parasporobacterium sp.]|nr:HAD family hydrolase [Parasporobacterium sp.]
MTDNKMVIFDLDGTLWDSAQTVTDSWNMVFARAMSNYARGNEKDRAFAESLRLITVDDMKSVMGRTMGELAAILMPRSDPKLRELVFQECSDFEIEYITEHGGTLYPDAADIMAELIRRGYKLAVVSNCQTDYIKAFMVSMNMEKYFCDYEEWGRTRMEKGDNIRLVMERCGCDHAIYVGDTQKDCDAADKAGIPFVLAAYGFGNADHYAAVIHEMKELPDAADKIFEQMN